MATSGYTLPGCMVVHKPVCIRECLAIPGILSNFNSAKIIAMSPKNQPVKITAAFKDYEKLNAGIKRLEEDVTRIRKTRDALLGSAGSEITDLVAQEIVDYDEQVIQTETRINEYEFELEKAVTYLESVFNKISIDKTIRAESAGTKGFLIYRNDKNKFSREREPKSLL